MGETNSKRILDPFPKHLKVLICNQDAFGQLAIAALGDAIQYRGQAIWGTKGNLKI